MVDNFSKVKDFKLMYEYISKIGSQIEVLRIKVQDRTNLKSNHYWFMVLLTKLTNLKTIKVHQSSTGVATTDFFKFMLKAVNYIQTENR